MTIAQATDYGTDEIMNSPKKTTQVPIAPNERFVDRHVGLDAAEIKAMLDTLGCSEMSTLLSEVIPEAIRTSRPLDLAEPAGPEGLGEHDAIETLRAIAARNLLFRNHIGMGYHATVTPPVIRRAILENPGWYTQYTPYQAEISQGRLEALLNFQTIISDLTGLPIAGASLLDEATAAAEAMVMCVAHTRSKKNTFFVSCHCHPQTIEVIRTRAEGLGITVLVGDPETFDPSDSDLAGLLVQYPRTDGVVVDFRALVARATEHGVLVVAAADPMSLCLLTPPGEWGAAIAVGSTQRFGVPMGFGGPHAAYLACREDLMRKMPGRLIGVSKDTNGKTALRMALQTREQHIRRDKATSNICTAQVLLAIIASMYGVYHGPAGLRAIASRINRLTNTLAEGLRCIGHNPTPEGRPFFDTLFVRLAEATDAPTIHAAAAACRVNLRHCEDPAIVGVTIDETTRPSDIEQLLAIFSTGTSTEAPALATLPRVTTDFGTCTRTSDYMTHAVFNKHHSETELMRYAATLQGRDLSLTHSMIPLGSCTMKLNAAAEMLPITWPTIANLHPFAPSSQTVGMIEIIQQLESWLAEITGFCAVSMQPNAGSQGEYAGLMVIRAFHRDNNQAQRTKCIIPLSAHGTNPASAVVAGMDVVPVKCTDDGDIDLNDLRARIEACGDELAAVMITYPSTHGVFEAGVIEACQLIHDAGGMVYLDGANMNAQVGLARPAELGADVCHLNLHKTFAIPHGGGGPGMGPIGVVEKLRPFLPTHPVLVPKSAGKKAIGPVSAAPYGSAMVLPISWMYIAMMGADGLRHASELAILSANYMAKRLAEHFDVLFVNEHGRCAHEFILDCRAFDKNVGIKIDDIAKRLMDYGFHAPTMSWPVPGTLMVEPTESESLAELDRYCDALILIRHEIAAIENGESDASDNPLKNAPHTMAVVVADEWTHPYTRTQAAFPAPWLRERKFWPHVGRVDNPYGDRNLACSCEGMDAY